MKGKRMLACGVLLGLLLLLGSPVGSEARGPHFFFDFGIPLWAGPGWWGPPYPAYAAPPVIVQAPPAYGQPAPAPAPPATSYWYYCPNPQGYYPYIQQCPAGWLQVVPPTTPPR